MLCTSYFSDKTLKRKVFVWPFLLTAALAFYGSYLVGKTNFWLSYTLLIIAGTVMYAPYGPFFAIIPEIMPTNVTAGVIAIINSFEELGSFAGSYIVGYLNGVTGGFDASLYFYGGFTNCFHHPDFDCCKKSSRYTERNACSSEG